VACCRGRRATNPLPSLAGAIPLGSPGPDTCIPIADETQHDPGHRRWVLRRLCTQQTRWPEPVRVSANLSALQIRPELVDDVAAPLCEYRLTPRAAAPRVTNSTVLNSAVKPVITQLWARRQAGPDFGVGYSSLGAEAHPVTLRELSARLHGDTCSPGYGRPAGERAAARAAQRSPVKPVLSRYAQRAGGLRGWAMARPARCERGPAAWRRIERGRPRRPGRSPVRRGRR
jgi:hypothetical protein